VGLIKRALTQSPEDYQRSIDKGLDRAFENAARDSRRLADLKAVIFSDLHRGARDGADDFARCEPAYSAALGSYLERDFELWLLGDVEELWENDIPEVMPRYDALLDLERSFHEGPGLRRFFGNHDVFWGEGDFAATHLPGLDVVEGLRLALLDADDKPLGTLFLVHGHQGTDFSDRHRKISRFALRRGWRKIQSWQGFLSTTPAENHQLRFKHDVAMYQWARRRAVEGERDERPVLIAGHTHHPVFPGKPPQQPDSEDAARLEERLRRARDANAPEAERARLAAELEMVRAIGRKEPYDPSDIDPPCYFNTGCCCFPDRDVTCLEISDEEIRLMRWLDDQGDPEPKRLARVSLASVLAQVRSA
jgi:hypothetical protein